MGAPEATMALSAAKHAMRPTQARGLAAAAGMSLLDTSLTLQPARTWNQAVKDGFQAVPLEEIFKDKRVVTFAVPGAFTGTCSSVHVPSYVAEHDYLKQQGVDSIICVSVNDPYCMHAWAQGMFVEDKIEMFADPDGSFTKFMGQEVELAHAQLSPTRSNRYSMLVEDGQIMEINAEAAPSDVKVSDAYTMGRCVHRFKKATKGYV